MSKSKIIIIAIAFILAVGFYGYRFIDNGKTTKQVETTEEVEVVWDSKSTIVAEKTKLEEVKTEIDETIEEEFPLDTAESSVQNAIHRMSHSKVYAKDKWGSLQPTKKRVDRLLVVVEENRYVYQHPDIYIHILERWQKDDFSEAVSDHNTIWRLQNGTIGEATRLLTEEEEIEYIKKHFK